MIRLVVFDMAGTTVNENQLVYKTLQKAIRDVGVEVSLEEIIKFGAGKAKDQAVRDILNGIKGDSVPNSLSDEVFQNFRSLLEKAYDKADISPQPGAESTFTQLQELGIKVALNTGYPRKIADQLLTKLGWKDNPLIDFTITSDEVEKGRPFPFMIQKAMDHFNISDSQEVAKIGDSLVDIEEGRNAGCGKVFSITTGAYSAEKLKAKHPDAVLDHLEELLPAIKCTNT